MSIAIESAELMERVQWLLAEGAQAAVQEPDKKTAVAEELAVVIVSSLGLSSALEGPAALTAGLDVSSAVLAKLETNEVRYPADDFRGRFRRPELEKSSEHQNFSVLARSHC